MDAAPLKPLLEALAALADGDGWMSRARCVSADPELFFPAKGVTPDGAKRLCATCPVAAECLEYGLALEAADAAADGRTVTSTHRHGVFGGLTAKERGALDRDIQAA